MAASVELLKAARAKIADPANWTQQSAARNKVGRRVNSTSDQAVCWCGYGALWSQTLDRIGTPAEQILDDACEQMHGDQHLINVNDRLGHQAVLAVYDLAITIAEARNA